MINRRFYIFLPTVFCFILSFCSGVWAQCEDLNHFSRFKIVLEKYNLEKNPYLSIVINKNGSGTYIESIKKAEYDSERSFSFKLTLPQLEYLYYKVMINNFFDTEKTYGDKEMEEGFITKLYVNIEGREHTVTMYDSRCYAADMLILAILEIIPRTYSSNFMLY